MEKCMTCTNRYACSDISEFNCQHNHYMYYKEDSSKINDNCICNDKEIYGRDVSMTIIKNKLIIESSKCRCGAFEEAFEINYCFKCGRKLS